MTLYSLAVAAGLVAAFAAAAVRLKPPTHLGTLALIAVLAGAGGARLLGLLIPPGTGAFYLGGLLLALAASLAFLRLVRADIAATFDACAPAVLLGYGIGKFGCFAAGC